MTYNNFPGALLLTAPAWISGTTTGCPGDDQRGVTRPIGSACDIGAIESPYTLWRIYLPLIVR